MGCDAQKWRFLEYACSQNIYKICGTTSLERQYPVLWNGGFTAQEYSNVHIREGPTKLHTRTAVLQVNYRRWRKKALFVYINIQTADGFIGCVSLPAQKCLPNSQKNCWCISIWWWVRRGKDIKAVIINEERFRILLMAAESLDRK